VNLTLHMFEPQTLEQLVPGTLEFLDD
jgi:hypothetical protein